MGGGAFVRCVFLMSHRSHFEALRLSNFEHGVGRTTEFIETLVRTPERVEFTRIRINAWNDYCELDFFVFPMCLTSFYFFARCPVLPHLSLTLTRKRKCSFRHTHLSKFIERISLLPAELKIGSSIAATEVRVIVPRRDPNLHLKLGIIIMNFIYFFQLRSPIENI